MINQLAASLKEISLAEIENISYVKLTANKPPWEKTKIQVQTRQSYTLLATGKINWSHRDPELYGGPGFHLWSRIPGGHIRNVVRNTGTFTADSSGILELGVYFGIWANHEGDLEPHSNNYSALSGELEVISILWKNSPITGLKKLTLLNNSVLLKEAFRQLTHPVQIPTGWDYLNETGVSDIYVSAREGNRPCIKLDASNDQGILRKPLDFLISESTQLKWDWKLLEHPSRNREDETRSHDYISVAAEFDNGRDLTWIWSSQLPIDYYFDCPVKSWAKRETHYVIRTGLEEGTEWLHESRNLFTDVGRSMGFKPKRITAIWLIGVATFQHAKARAEFSNISLKDGKKSLQIL